MTGPESPVPAPPPAPPPAPARRRRWPWVLGGLGALLLVGVFVGLPALLSSDAVRGVLEAEATRALGRPVACADLDVSLLGNPRLLLRGLTVGNPPGFGGEPLAKIRSLEAGLDWSFLWSRKLRITRLAFSGVEARVHRQSDGRTNLEGLALRVPGPGAPASLLAAAAPPAVSLEVSRIRLDGSSILLEDALAGISAALEGIALDAKVEELPLDGSAVGVLQRASLGGRLEVSSGKAEGLELSGLSCAFSLLDGVATLGGGQGTLNGGELAFSGKVDFQDPHRPAFALKTHMGGNRLGGELGRRYLGPLLVYVTEFSEGKVRSGDLDLAWKGSTLEEMQATLLGSFALSLDVGFDLARNPVLGVVSRMHIGESMAFTGMEASGTVGNGTVSNEVRCTAAETGLEMKGTLRLSDHVIHYWISGVGKLRRVLGEKPFVLGGTLENPTLDFGELLKNQVQDKLEEKVKEEATKLLEGILP